jgi:hypothetical protein
MLFSKLTLKIACHNVNSLVIKCRNVSTDICLKGILGSLDLVDCGIVIIKITLYQKHS